MRTKKKPPPKKKKEKINLDMVTTDVLANKSGITFSKVTYLYRQRIIDRDPDTKKFSVKKCLPTIKKYLKQQGMGARAGRKSDVQINFENTLIDKLIKEAEENGIEGTSILDELLKNPKLPTTEATRIGAIMKAIQTSQEIKVRTGELVNLKEMERECFKAGRFYRDAVFAVPDRISDQLAAIKSGAKVQKMLIKELTKAANTVPKGKQFGFLKN